MKTVLIDTDPGTDDALALIVALNSPEIDVASVTTVGGNARLADTTRNALRILAYLDSLRHGMPPPVPGIAGLQELQVEAAIRRSIALKRPVDLAAELPLEL